MPKEITFALVKSLRILYFAAIEKVLNKFANPQWLIKIIFLIMSGLAFHIRFLSSFMGR